MDRGRFPLPEIAVYLLLTGYPPSPLPRILGIITLAGNDVENAFGSEIDYAMLVKLYGASNDGESRYSPATCIGCRTGVLAGNPDPKYISTSYVERQNLSMRMGMRRFTRLTNGHSKKVENHGHQVALYFMHYNFCRVHSSLRVTPAMEAGLTDHVWTLAEVCALLPEKKVNARFDKNLVLQALARA